MNLEKHYKRFHVSSNVNTQSLLKYLDNYIYTQTQLSIPIVMDSDGILPVMHSIVGTYRGYEQCDNFLNILWEPIRTDSSKLFLDAYEQTPDDFYVSILGIWNSNTEAAEKITGFLVRSYE